MSRPFMRSATRLCSMTHLELPPDFFPETGQCSHLGVLFKNVSQRARNGRYHEAYCVNHHDRYTRPETAIPMDSTWVDDPTKFGLDILLNLGMPRVDEAGNRLSLDRVDNSEGYFIWNLRWATPREQMQNTSRGRYVPDGTMWSG